MLIYAQRYPLDTSVTALLLAGFVLFLSCAERYPSTPLSYSSCWLCVVFVLCRALSYRHVSVTVLLLAGFVLFLSCAQSYPLYTSQLQLFFLLALCCYCLVPSVIVSTPLSYSSSCWLCVVFVPCRALSYRHVSVTALLLAGFVLFLSCTQSYPLYTSQLQLFLLALCCFCPVPSVILSTRLSYSSSSCWLCVVFVLCPELSSLYLSVTALLLAGFVLFLSCAERYLSYSSYSCWLCVVFVSLHLSVTALLAGFVLFLSRAERYPIDTSQLQLFFLLALCCFCPVPRVILSTPLSYSSSSCWLCCFCPVPRVILSTPLSYSSSSCWLCVVFVLCPELSSRHLSYSSSCWLCVVFVPCRALSSRHLSVTALLAGFVLFLSCAQSYPLDTSQLQLFFLLALCCFCPVPSVILSTPLSYSSSSCWLCVVFVLCRALSSRHLSVTALLAGFVLFLSCAQSYVALLTNVQQTHCTLRQWIFPFVKHVGAHYGRAVPTWVSECHIPVIPSLFPHQICYNCGSV